MTYCTICKKDDCWWATQPHSVLWGDWIDDPAPLQELLARVYEVYMRNTLSDSMIQERK